MVSHNVIAADFTKHRRVLIDQELSDFKKNIIEMIEKIEDVPALQDIHKSAKALFSLESQRRERVVLATSLATSTELSKYRKLKSALPHSLLLMRIGDFVFAFDEDAIRLHPLTPAGGMLHAPIQHLNNAKKTPFVLCHYTYKEGLELFRDRTGAVVVM